MQRGKIKLKPIAVPETTFSLISREKLIAIYSAMLRCRAVSQRIGKNARGKGLAAEGLEAMIAGTAIDLLEGDTIVRTGFEVFANLVRGGKLGKQNGRRSAPGGDCMGVATALAFGAGVALVNKTERNGMIVAVYSDKATTASPAWSQMVRIAAEHRLPILFVARGECSAIVPAAGGGLIPRIPVDANDAVAVHRVATESIAHARKGNGPTLIECLKINMQSGVSSGRASMRKTNDSVDAMERYMAHKGISVSKVKTRILTSLRRSLDKTVKAIDAAQCCSDSNA